MTNLRTGGFVLTVTKASRLPDALYAIFCFAEQKARCGNEAQLQARTTGNWGINYLNACIMANEVLCNMMEYCQNEMRSSNAVRVQIASCYS